MARDHGDIVRNGLALRKAGNEMIRLLGGRALHPVNVKPGGFHRVPNPRAPDVMIEGLSLEGRKRRRLG